MKFQMIISNKSNKIAVRHIRKYSHYTNKNEIKNYVDSHLKFPETPQKFACGYPLLMFAVIDQGTFYFNELRKQEK